VTCAKRTVVCVITSSSRSVVGVNYCRNPQEVCPREPGEGYEKCKSICDQVGHAEEDALAQAKATGMELRGAVAEISGHEYACSDCQRQLYDAGIKWIGRGVTSL
jgi:deoxycytidylate deaminase